MFMHSFKLTHLGISSISLFVFIIFTCNCWFTWFVSSGLSIGSMCSFHIVLATRKNNAIYKKYIGPNISTVKVVVVHWQAISDLWQHYELNSPTKVLSLTALFSSCKLRGEISFTEPIHLTLGLLLFYCLQLSLALLSFPMSHVFSWYVKVQYKNSGLIWFWNSFTWLSSRVKFP